MTECYFTLVQSVPVWSIVGEVHQVGVEVQLVRVLVDQVGLDTDSLYKCDWSVAVPHYVEDVGNHHGLPQHPSKPTASVVGQA